MADLTHLRLERPSDGVVLLVLDNPDLRNAMSPEMTSSWVTAIDELATDPSVRVVVVTGEGTAFCSGGITSWLAAEPDASVDELRTRMIAFYRAWLSIRRLEVPTIAAINGATIGAGLCMALACDIRYATDSAKLGMPFLKLGLHPGMAGTFLLPNAVGAAAARDLLLTGRLVQGAARGLPGGGPRGRRRRGRERPDRDPAHQARPGRGRSPRPRLGPAVGGPGPARHDGHRGSPGGHRSEPGEAARAVRRTLSDPDPDRRRDPRAIVVTLAFPCEHHRMARRPRLGRQPRESRGPRSIRTSGTCAGACG